VANVALIGVSGLSGYIGSALRRIDHPDLGLVETRPFSTISLKSIDSEIERIAKTGATGFLHLAWPASSSSDNYRMSHRNFEALEKTLAVRRACEREGIHFFGLGTCIDKGIDLNSNYSVAKYTVRQVLLKEIDGHRMTWIRPYFVFDEKRWPRFIHSEDLQRVTIEDNSPRDFIHVMDVAFGIAHVLDQGTTGEINLGSGILRRPSDICDVIGKNYLITNKSNHFLEKDSNKLTQDEPLWMGNSWQATFTSKFFGDINGRE
jgi:nucleoside-diphosphate-sugar epimerase